MLPEVVWKLLTCLFLYLFPGCRWEERNNAFSQWFYCRVFLSVCTYFLLHHLYVTDPYFSLVSINWSHNLILINQSTEYQLFSSSYSHTLFFPIFFAVFASPYRFVLMDVGHHQTTISPGHLFTDKFIGFLIIFSQMQR